MWLIPLITLLHAHATNLHYTSQQLWFTQVLDHFHVPYQEAGEFQQRYWVVDDYWDAQNGPIFLYLCGEYTCPGVPDNRLYPMQLAKFHNARFMVLEHRYYGASLPFGQASALPQLFRYLEVDQALADIAYFIQQINKGLSRTPKWLVIGGSYPGALAAWFRTKYPDLVVGAWSSSGVVRTISNYTDFDKQTYLSAIKSGQSCVDAYKDVNAYVEAQYKAGTASTVTDIFGSTSFFEGWDMKPVLFYVTDMMAELIQYGHRTELCKALTSAKTSVDRLNALKVIANKYGVNEPQGYALNSLRSYVWEVENSGRQWYWQKCTQVGYFQGPSEYQMRSSLLDMDYWSWFCNLVFDYPGGLPMPGGIDVTRAELNYKGSNIIFLNGIEDPWRWAGNMEWRDETRPSIVVDCIDCGHCVDLYTPTANDSRNLIKARSTIAQYVAQWLK